MTNIGDIRIRGPIVALAMETEKLAYQPGRKTGTRTNRDRAEEGKLLCDLLEILTGCDEEPEIKAGDAICQIMHYVRLAGGDPEQSISSARINFEAEVVEDPDDL